MEQNKETEEFFFPSSGNQLLFEGKEENIKLPHMHCFTP